ncbi:RRM 1 domain containing protein [Trichuris trichiura]|uniref:RRM 1 domain containing protein n=1 Tax=Trichuris trichiura TaxID=36087 RepID=A0A077ZAK5_TRITR|nr:RRM 1 domain containing protein [Trichuris trichiura]
MESDVSRQLRVYLVKVGPVNKVTLKKGNSYAFVDFEDAESVPYAIEVMDGITLFGQRLRLRPKSGSTHSSRRNSSRDRLPMYPDEMMFRSHSFAGAIPLYDFAYPYGQHIIQPINASLIDADSFVSPWLDPNFRQRFESYFENYQWLSETAIWPFGDYGRLQPYETPSSETYRSSNHRERDRRKRAHREHRRTL